MIARTPVRSALLAVFAGDVLELGQQPPEAAPPKTPLPEESGGPPLLWITPETLRSLPAPPGPTGTAEPASGGLCLLQRCAVVAFYRAL